MADDVTSKPSDKASRHFCNIGDSLEDAAAGIGDIVEDAVENIEGLYDRVKNAAVDACREAKDTMSCVVIDSMQGCAIGHALCGYQ